MSGDGDLPARRQRHDDPRQRRRDPAVRPALGLGQRAAALRPARQLVARAEPRARRRHAHRRRPVRERDRLHREPGRDLLRRRAPSSTWPGSSRRPATSPTRTSSRTTTLHADRGGRERGRIEATAIALLGTEAANYGTLHAPDGTIALVAGEKVVLTQLGAHLAVMVEGAAGGAGRAAIEQTGVVDAGAARCRSRPATSLARDQPRGHHARRRDRAARGERHGAGGGTARRERPQRRRDRRRRSR